MQYSRCNGRWTYGQGFPKSMDISKAIDKAAGAEREVVGSKLGLPGYADTATTGRMLPGQETGAAVGYLDITAPATDAAREWEGWGTALKPAWDTLAANRPIPAEPCPSRAVAQPSPSEERALPAGARSPHPPSPARG